MNAYIGDVVRGYITGNPVVSYFTEIYGGNDDKFIEEYGRKFFLLYLKPI